MLFASNSFAAFIVFCGERVYYCLLEACGHVFLEFVSKLFFFEIVEHCGLESRETKVVVFFVDHRAGEVDGIGVAFLCERFYFWAAGVGGF